MNDGFLFVALIIVFMVAIMAIGAAGDYAMSHQSEIEKKCECDAY